MRWRLANHFNNRYLDSSSRYINGIQYKTLILSRYVLKQLIATTAGVAVVLLLIIMSSRFSIYLADAAAGKLAAEILFPVMAYRFPGFLELILPLSFFIALLMVYGRLYTDNEMAVLNACGISPHRMYSLAFITACGVAVIVGSITLFISPWGAQHVERLFQQQSEQSLDSLTPGQFHQQKDQGLVIYIEPQEEGANGFGDIFITSTGDQPKPTRLSRAQSVIAKTAARATSTDTPPPPAQVSTVITAKSGNFFIDEETNTRYLTMNNGFQLQGVSGQLDYRVTEFDKLNHKFSEASSAFVSSKRDSVSTKQLLQSQSLEDIALLQWRFSLLLIAPIISLIAFPLSKINPRQGRFARILPAIILYLSYIVLLSSARSAIEKGDLNPYPGIGLVHLLYLGIGLALYFNPAIKLLARRPNPRPASDLQSVKD